MIEFTHQGYLALLQFIKDLHYEIVCFRDVRQDGSYVILRHDVDFSPEKALEMAYLDHQFGVSSTFFFLLTSPYYNILSKSGVGCVKEIAKLGHECGLHYDCEGFERLSSEARRQRVRSLAECLGESVGEPIRSIAQHKPARSAIRERFSPYLDAYSAPFFENIGYISDSRGAFRVPDVHEFFRRNRRSQLVIHPIWWHAQPKTRDEVFEFIEKEYSIKMADLLKSESKTIEDFLNQTQLERPEVAPTL
jgi:hypothetical protein